MAKKAKPRHRGPRAKAANAAPGHNLAVNKAESKKFFDQLDALFKEKAEEAASYASKINNVYESAANDLGVGKKAFKEAYDEHKFISNLLKRRKEMTPEQRHDVDRVILAVSSFKSMPLFQYAQENGERAESVKAFTPPETVKPEAVPEGQTVN